MIERPGPGQPATAITFSRKTIEDWAGRDLTEVEMAQLHAAIADSGIPETIAALVDTLRPRADASMVAQALANMATRISDDLDRFLSTAPEGNVLTITATPAHDSEAEPEEGFDFCAVVAEVSHDRLEEGPLDVLRADDGRVLISPESHLLDLSTDQAFQTATQIITAAALSRRSR
ncbi:hypothetical protein ACIBI7_50570 [Nonomuraea fuscirosea]|uniref:hypothetical protein n=1 Tax=Nonomuraea fuscirosea TaxID=1291556 RepID=UPI0037BC712B